MKIKKLLLSLVVVFFLFVSFAWFYKNYVNPPAKIIEEIEDATIKEVMKRYGEPTSKSTFFMSDSTLYEYQYGLYKHYPRELAPNRNIQIIEFYWDKDERTFVIWFHKKADSWVVLDNLEWYSNINF